ncbi:MAG: hypothetical protein IPH62_15250 [Ignavibacteriae bacterium]|nr:hypothetical protein [Ignavibacteriota bacterium]
MKTNIYPRNYFNPLEDLLTPEEIPEEIQADEKANLILRSIQAEIKNASIKKFGKLDFTFLYNSLFAECEFKISELIFDVMEANERINNQNRIINYFDKNRS